MYAQFLLRLATTDECSNIFDRAKNHYVISTNGISSVFATLMSSSRYYPDLSPLLRKFFLVNPITNSDTLITNTAHFLFYSNLVTQATLDSILSISDSPSADVFEHSPRCASAPKVVKHVKGARHVNVARQCSLARRKHAADAAPSEQRFWDQKMYKAIDILVRAGVSLYQMTWLRNTVTFEPGLLWPKRSLKISFINKVISFLDHAKFSFKKANFDHQQTQLIPEGYLLSEFVNAKDTPKTHILGTKEFFFGNPFIFYNFVNYEILDVKFGRNQ